MKLNPQKVALTVGAFFGLWHFVWGLLVAAGLAQTWLDFVYSIHFLNNPLVVQSFDLVKWVSLVLVTALVGYVLGYIFSILWNKMHK